MNPFIFVGLGGALGAMCRYALSTVSTNLTFPLMTFITNLLGAIAIGFIVGAASQRPEIPSWFVLFFKTGFCGGFTTFSTFSLETWQLLEKHNYVTGFSYAGLSLCLCVIGVIIGESFSKICFTS